MERYIEESLYFKNLDNENLRAILRCFSARIQTYQKGSNIINIGDEAINVYIIAAGSARSFSIDETGREYINKDFYRDDIFGLTYISNEMPVFNEYLKALEDTVVIICNGFRFLNPCENRCKRHVDCMKLSFNRLTKMISEDFYRIKIMSQSKTREKILSYLYQFKSRKKYFTIPYNQTELANYLSVERSALSVELNKLKKEGIIDFDGNTYRIIKKNKK